MNRIWAILAAMALIVPASRGIAQDDKQWTHQGTQAGEEIVGPDGGRMVWVPVGEFAMGSDAGAEDEKPVHQVRISRGFWFGKTAVTVGQWRRYCRETGKTMRKDIKDPPDDYPMVAISWDEAREYCKYYGLAMPSEAQWEYAARGAEARLYPWGNQWDAKRCCNDDNPGPEGFVCRVGSYPDGASWCGALDMAGNTSTWCQDWYQPTYYANCPGVDPQGPETGVKRVQRGGYCWGDAQECRCAARFGCEPDNTSGSGSARPCFTP